MKKFLMIIFLLVNLKSYSHDPVFIITFKKGTDIVDDSTKKKIIALGKSYNFFSNDSLSNDHYYQIDLWNFTCSDELDKDPMIGFKRAKKVIDILEKECGINRKNIRYIDEIARDKTRNAKFQHCEAMKRGIQADIR